jgi:hypothetical protein
LVACKPHSARRKVARGWTIVEPEGGILEGPAPEALLEPEPAPQECPSEAASLAVKPSKRKSKGKARGKGSLPAKGALDRLKDWGQKHRVEG